MSIFSQPFEPLPVNPAPPSREKHAGTTGHRWYTLVRILSALLGCLCAESMIAWAASPTSATPGKESVSAAIPGSAREPMPMQLSGVQYRLVALTFREPRIMSTGAGRKAYQHAIEIQLRGDAFTTDAVPGRFTLNGFSTTRSQRSADGKSTTAWLYGVSPSQLEQAAQARGGWSLQLQVLPRDHQSYSIAPTGKQKDLGQPPVILSELR